MGRRELDWADRFLRALGAMLPCSSPACCPVIRTFYCAARRDRPHATRQVSHLYIPWIVAVVFRSGLRGG